MIIFQMDWMWAVNEIGIKMTRLFGAAAAA